MTLSWTREHDHVFGPFLYARDRPPGWRPLAFIIGSGDDEDYAGADLRISGFGHTFMLALPRWLIPPQRVKVHPKDWDEATVKRLGRNWYWNVTEREFGVTYSEGHLGLKFGRQTHDSSTEKSWGCFLPWTQWRFIRTSHYTPEGNLIKTFPRAQRLPGGGSSWDREYEFGQTLPTIDFEFDDYDGERIVAKTRIEEREWRFGENWFKWLSLFRKPRIKRSLNLRFTAETGERKGSWKGGTIGHSVEIDVGETPEAAFRRYCTKHSMKFIGQAASSGE
jgi:hypothetical protein